MYIYIYIYIPVDMYTCPTLYLDEHTPAYTWDTHMLAHV